MVINNTQLLLKDLHSDSEEKREKATHQLEDYPFTRKDLPVIYKAIEECFAKELEEYWDIGNSLLQHLWQCNDHRTADFIVKLYPQLPDDKDVHFCALGTLVHIDSSKSIKAFANLLVTHQPDLDDLIKILFIPLYHILNGRLLFPKLFSLLGNESYKSHIYLLSTSLCRGHHLPLKAFVDYKDQVKDDFVTLLEEFKKTNRGADDQNRTDDYIDHFDMLEILTEFMALFPHDKEIFDLLQKTLTVSHPLIKALGVKALLRNGFTVPKEIIDEIAAHHIARLTLCSAVYGINKPELFPQEYHSQYHFAELDLVSYLWFPSVFNCPPDEIEFLDTRELPGSEDTKDFDGCEDGGRYYLFKYRYFNDENGWLTGISGPHPLDVNDIYYDGAPLTCTNFKKLNEMTLDEHFKDLTGDASQ